MKIAVLMDTRELSGPAKQLLALAPRLMAGGAEIRCIVLRDDRAGRTPFVRGLEDARVPFTEVPCSRGLCRGVVTRLCEALADYDPDILQTHSYRPTALAAAMRLRRPRWRWIAFFHGATAENPKVRAYHALDNVLMRLSDRIVVVATPQLRRFVGPAPPVTVIPNAVLERSGSPAAPLDLREVSTGGTRIVVIGRLSREKGVDLFLKAARELLDRGVAVVAIVAGDGIDRARLEALRDRLRLRDRVLFAGHVEAVDSLYDWCELVVIPSRSEGMPNVLLEAVRRGCRVVTTDVGNVREIIGEAPFAEVVRRGDPRALASGIQVAIQRLGEPLSGEHRDRLLKRYSLDTRANQHLQLYRAVLGSAEGRS